MASPFALDLEKMKEMWQYSLMGEKKKKNFLGMYTENKSFDVQLKEAAALFGGNEREVCGPEPIHQFCHVDHAGAIDMVHKDKEKYSFVPGSVIVPLEKEGREIYIRTLEHRVLIPNGDILIFRGDLPHGGITSRVSGSPQKVALHAHLDSKSVDRTQQLIGLSSGVDHYLPQEHLMLHDVDQTIHSFLESHRSLNSKMGDFFCRRGDGVDKFLDRASHPQDVQMAKEFKSLLEDLNRTHNTYQRVNRISEKRGWTADACADVPTRRSKRSAVINRERLKDL
ncbi:unnamed protein product [Cylindrotheca closterium]|uniref:Uncharacterized protein n=1 Tax=Cylindrotheca closterium TaxID=2856 RepID=A0AAD2GBG2_9STRA|nr:unnamed protein product [Cylindrotheca closterium]